MCRQYRWYRAIGKPVLNEKGKIVSVCGFLIDIHKHKEKNLLQQRFISGLSHEYVTVWVINHDLTVELYQQTKKGDHIAQEAIEKFAKENNYQKSMLRHSLTPSKILIAFSASVSGIAAPISS